MPIQEPLCFLICLTLLMQAGQRSPRSLDSAGDGRSAGRWPAGARRRDGHGGDAAPAAGELAVFCRPVVTAPAAARGDGTVLADAWLPDFVQLGELERHLGDGVIEAVVDGLTI